MPECFNWCCLILHRLLPSYSFSLLSKLGCVKFIPGLQQCNFSRHSGLQSLSFSELTSPSIEDNLTKTTFLKLCFLSAQPLIQMAYDHIKRVTMYGSLPQMIQIARCVIIHTYIKHLLYKVSSWILRKHPRLGNKLYGFDTHNSFFPDISPYVPEPQLFCIQRPEFLHCNSIQNLTRCISTLPLYIFCFNYNCSFI